MNRIIFLHGGPGFKDYLDLYFSSKIGEYNCVFYDQIQGAEVTVKNLTNQLDEIINQKDGKVLLLGHSWGGVLATEYAKNNLDKVDGLILMSTGLNSAQWTLYNQELENIGKSDIERDELLFTLNERKEGKKMLEHESWNEFSKETFDAIFKDYLQSYDLLKDLDQLTIPILNIYGENDLRFSKAVTTTFKVKNPCIQDLEIKGSGHFPYILEKNMYLITRSINQFIQKNYL